MSVAKKKVDTKEQNISSAINKLYKRIVVINYICLYMNTRIHIF